MNNKAETLIVRHPRRSNAKAEDLIIFRKITFGEGFAVPDYSGMTL